MSAELVCPMCEGVQVTVLFTSRGGYDIVRCEGCRLAFTDARSAPPPSELYPPFEQSDTAAQRRARSMLSVFQLQRAHVVERVARHGRLLDYGAGSGAFARFMAGRGFDVVGLEPFSLGAPTEEPSLTLLRAPLEQVKATLGTFDVITLWQVLEHLEHPVAVLASLRSLLKPGGSLVVSVPNFGSVQSALFKGDWFHLDPPRHLLHFEHDTLVDCLGRAGFAPGAESPFLPEYGTSGWIQSALNAVLPHRNFLYEWVKDRGALASLSPLSIAGHFVASVATSVPIFGASVPVEWLASKANLAASLTIAAQVAEARP